MFDVLSVPTNPGREFPRDGTCFIAEVGEIKVVSSAGVRVNGELVTEDEGTAVYDVVNGD